MPLSREEGGPWGASPAAREGGGATPGPETTRTGSASHTRGQRGHCTPSCPGPRARGWRCPFSPPSTGPPSPLSPCCPRLAFTHPLGPTLSPLVTGHHPAPPCFSSHGHPALSPACWSLVFLWHSIFPPWPPRPLVRAEARPRDSFPGPCRATQKRRGASRGGEGSEQHRAGGRAC